MQTIDRPRLAVKSATARYLASCLDGNSAKDRRQIIANLAPVFLSLTETRDKRRLLESAWYEAAQLLDQVFQPHIGQGSTRLTAKDSALFRGTMLTGGYYRTLKSGDPMATIEPDQFDTLIIDQDIDMHPVIARICQFESAHHHSVRSTEKRPRSRHYLFLAEPFLPWQMAALHARLQALDPGLECGPRQIVHKPIEEYRGPSTNVYIKLSQRITWHDLVGILGVPAEEPIARPRLVLPQPARTAAKPTRTRRPRAALDGYPWLAEQFADAEIRERVWRHILGDRIAQYPGRCHCLIDGHANGDANPSASLHHRVGMLPGYFCHAPVHGPGRLELNIGEMYRRITTADLANPKASFYYDPPATQHMWACRALFDIGYLDVDEWAAWPESTKPFVAYLRRKGAMIGPDRITLKGCGLSRETLAMTYEAIRLMSACKKAVKGEHKMTLTGEFLADWSGLPERTAAKAAMFVKLTGLLRLDSTHAHIARRRRMDGKPERASKAITRHETLKPMSVWRIEPIPG